MVDSILGDSLWSSVATNIGILKNQSWFMELMLGGAALCAGSMCSLRSRLRTSSPSAVKPSSPAVRNTGPSAESSKLQALKRGARAALEQAVKDGHLREALQTVRKLET